MIQSLEAAAGLFQVSGVTGGRPEEACGLRPNGEELKSYSISFCLVVFC